MSFEAKLKRWFGEAALTTEQQGDTNIYAEKPHTRMHMYWVTRLHNINKPHTHIHKNIYGLVYIYNTGKERCQHLEGGKLMQMHTHRWW